MPSFAGLASCFLLTGSQARPRWLQCTFSMSNGVALKLADRLNLGRGNEQNTRKDRRSAEPAEGMR